MTFDLQTRPLELTYETTSAGSSTWTCFLALALTVAFFCLLVIDEVWGTVWRTFFSLNKKTEGLSRNNGFEAVNSRWISFDEAGRLEGRHQLKISSVKWICSFQAFSQAFPKAYSRSVRRKRSSYGSSSLLVAFRFFRGVILLKNSNEWKC